MISLNWLPTSSLKNITRPQVVLEPNVGQQYQGYYTAGTNQLVVVECDCEKQLASIIAHEFRHHTQYELNTYFSPNGSVLDFALEYEEMIRVYFQTQPWELDALLYEHKLAPTELNTWWLYELVLVDNFSIE